MTATATAPAPTPTEPQVGNPLRRRLLRESAASLLRTTSGAFLVLLVPPVLIRQLGPTTYGAWAIAVEVGTYLGLLDLGALSAVGHFAAKHRDAVDGTGRVMSTLLALQLASIAAGAALLAALVALVPVVYPKLPAELVPSARLTLALVGGSSLLGLLATTCTGYFLSVGRLVVPSSITFASRLVGTGLVIVFASWGLGLGPLAAAWAGTSVLGYLVIGVAFRRLRVPVRRSLVDRTVGREMVSFSSAYGIWILAGLLVVGLDTTIVARIDFGGVAAFAAAAGAVSIVNAVYSSALAPLVPVAADLDAAGRRADLTELLLRITRLGGTAVVLGGAALALLADPVLTAWVGAETAAVGVPILRALVAGNVLRLVVMPYPVMLFGTGEHRRIRSTPVLEGVVNVAASIALGLAYGPTGVALGTLVGAAVGLAAHAFVNVPRTRSLDLTGAGFVRRGLGGPLLAALPVVVVVAAADAWPAGWWWPLAAAAWTATAVACWTVALTSAERRALSARVRRRGTTPADPARVPT
ncbi:MAG TPA: hypothetical protein VHK88_09940 [Aquihabitans sp.]|nr:hypothetical protein [Aquihabitans sp.]